MDASVALLQQTSKLVKLFKSDQPIKSVEDPLIKGAKEALKFFEEWESSVYRLKLDHSAMLSRECREDLASTVLGFEQLVYNRTTKFPGSYVIPYLTNSDICENIFCQIRSCRLGPTTHPNVFGYTHALTAVLLSQGLISTHGNASNNSKAASPLCMHTNSALNPYKSKKITL